MPVLAWVLSGWCNSAPVCRTSAKSSPSRAALARHRAEAQTPSFYRSTTISIISGNTSGLKPVQWRALERLAQKRIAPDAIIDRDTARALAAISSELNRQVGLLVHRSGQIEAVLVGDFNRITIPALAGSGSGSRLRGLRCIHTVLASSGLNEEDIMDLACLRLDMLSALSVRNSLPDMLYTAHLIPQRDQDRDWAELEPVHPANQTVSCIALIEALE